MDRHRSADARDTRTGTGDFARGFLKLFAVVVVATRQSVSLVRRSPVDDELAVVTCSCPLSKDTAACGGTIRGAPAYLFVDWAADGNFLNFVFCQPAPPPAVSRHRSKVRARTHA